MKFAFNITKKNKKTKLNIYEYIPEAGKYSNWLGYKYACPTYQELFKAYINKLVTKYYWYKHITVPDIITITTDTILQQLYDTCQNTPINFKLPFNQSKMLVEILTDIITEPEFCNIVKREKIQVGTNTLSIYTFDSSI